MRHHRQPAVLSRLQNCPLAGAAGCSGSFAAWRELPPQSHVWQTERNWKPLVWKGQEDAVQLPARQGLQVEPPPAKDCGVAHTTLPLALRWLPLVGQILLLGGLAAQMCGRCGRYERLQSGR